MSMFTVKSKSPTASPSPYKMAQLTGRGAGAKASTETPENATRAKQLNRPFIVAVLGHRSVLESHCNARACQCSASWRWFDVMATRTRTAKFQLSHSTWNQYRVVRRKAFCASDQEKGRWPAPSLIDIFRLCRSFSP